MRISQIETILHDDYPHLIHVLVHTDEGLVGVGESYHRPEAIAAYVQTEIAPRILGEPAQNLVRLWSTIGSFTDGGRAFSGTISIESSATSALDIALWDLRAKAQGLPLHAALGGAARESIRVYNTAMGSGPGHLPPPGTPRHERHRHEDWGLSSTHETDYDDWTASLERPGELAQELLDEGVTAMKVFPFMRLGDITQGRSITARQLEENVALVREIRETVGNKMDVAVDLAFMWAAAPALQISMALDELGLMWIEDPLRTSSLDALARLAAKLRTPVAAFDHFSGLPAYIRLIESGGVSLVRLDLQWVGGVTEALRIADYADAKGLAVILHDCTGPVQWATSIHVSVHLKNAMLQESARALYKDVYPKLIERVPRVVDGSALPDDGPGHGAVLRDEYLAGATRRRSTIRNGEFVTEAVGE